MTTNRFAAIVGPAPAEVGDGVDQRDAAGAAAPLKNEVGSQKIGSSSYAGLGEQKRRGPAKLNRSRPMSSKRT